ncbi:hypothetical protein M404DRAFT_33914 [Pisolithus tinctorius Marx 270]|uniref:Uncharacterized protein n=1 Tax=Pisolithus tinctorius Marx 270 TaxID=870435 RepID=A0A0C3NKA3_PISTI|nr:hypothetical protein M404DRAFT_33914 [Pisolithus tinctorius Marx 270]
MHDMRIPMPDTGRLTSEGDITRAPMTRVPLVVYPGSEGILKAAKHKYDRDLFFKRIIEDPQAFKNFNITPDGFISLKLPDRTVFCVPDIEVDGKRLREKDGVIYS